ncbi:MAG: YceI family protein [Chloroflexi bacterium]|nr:YceI family protein [Chloroflexota bacterium]
MSTLRTLALPLVALALAACGGAAQPAATATAQPTAAAATPTPAPTATASLIAATQTSSGGLTFTVLSGSKAVVRVTEQLADRQNLSDAVLTGEKVTGEFTLNPDGTFAPSSKVVVDLTVLASDNRQRDNFIKNDTLETRRFPEAVFVPTRTQSLGLPLAASGEMSFKLIGQMTVHGVTKEATFDVKATRNGADLTSTATVSPAFQFGTFGMTQPRVFSVLSIKDEIRLEVQLVAKQKI